MNSIQIQSRTPVFFFFSIRMPVILLAALLPLVTMAAPADFEKLYRKQCGTCHGNEGDGRGRAGAQLTPPASSFIAPDRRQHLTKQYIEGIIRDGKAGTAMAGYGRRLSPVQIAGVADYVYSRFVNPGAASDSTSPTDKGRELYAKHCSACHGDNGNTAVWARNGLNPPPRNFTSEAAREELSRERMLTSVTHGRPGTAMMSFKERLSTAEIESIVDFVRKEFMQGEVLKSQSLPPAQKAQPAISFQPPPDVFPQGLKGDTHAGRQFYMKNCFTCHGKDGDGNGPRAHFNRPRPRDFTSIDTAANFDRERLYRAIQQGKRGTVMPAWGTVLTDQQIADVAEFVYLQFIKKKI